MNKRIIIRIGALLLTIGFYSCKPEPTIPDQNKIFASYLLDYNISENKTTAFVSFHLGEPSSSNQQKLELKHPSMVTYQGDQLVFESNKRIYKKEFVGLVEDIFVYTNYNGSQYANAITMVDTIMLMVSDSADAQSDYYFQVEGPALNANEVIDIHIESINSGIVLGSSFENLSGLNVQVNSSQLTSLGSGPTIVRASRRLDISSGIQGPPVGGLIQTRYSIQDTVYIY